MSRTRINRLVLLAALLAAGLALTCIGTCAIVAGQIDPDSILGT